MPDQLFVSLWLALAPSVLPPAAPPPLRLDPVIVERVIASAAAQVKRCYRAPRVSREARQITTRLLVRYAADGTLADMPVLLAQTGLTPVNQRFASQMAEAARLAVIMCAPLRLPPADYENGWDEIELTFSYALPV